MVRFGSKLAALALAGSLTTGALAGENVMVVFDGSNSMWGQIDGTAKIEIARDVMQNLLGEWTEDRKVGLMAYGHRRRGDCTDIETLVTPGEGARDEILRRINAITPTGKTPLSAAVERAAIELSYTDQPATVVLISDGLESCGRDPCALAAALEKAGVDFTAHVVGFGLASDADADSLACIAEKTGGTYISASNAAELGQALSDVAVAVAAAPEPEPVVVEPEPEPEPEAPQVALNVPASAIAGSVITVGWTPTVDARDYVTIVPVGTKEGKYKTYVTVTDQSDGLLQMPAFPGQYEVRYVFNATGETLGIEAIEVVDPEVTVSGPESVVVGADFDVSWTGTVTEHDYVTIVPVGADEGKYLDYATVVGNSEDELTAPGDPGLYELRYVLKHKGRTVARAAIEVVEASVTLDGPESVLIGEEFAVSWQGGVNKNDYVTIVPVGAKDDAYGDYLIIRDDSEGDLTAPADTGLYELRYVLKQDTRVLATRMIEVTEANVTILAPDTALAGSEFEVSWTGMVDKNDYITIVPVDADEGTLDNYFVVRDATGKNLQAPAEPGLYEVRYVLREGARTMARAAIEITAPEVTVSAPDTALTGSTFAVSWTGAVDNKDYVTIVPMGADEGTLGKYIVIRNATEKDLQAPAEPGLYEIRYILREGSKTMARAAIEIIAPEVTVTAPGTALAGSAIKVSWTGAVNYRDYVAIVPMGADEGTLGNYITTRDVTEKDLRAPAEPGLYEIRYVLREGVKTLARAAIEIVEPEVSLSAPGEIRAGDKLRVGWSGAVEGNDYITLVPMGSKDKAYGEYFKVRDAAEHDMNVPEETGLYELRYILREGGRVMARLPVEVLDADAALESGASLSAPDTAAPGAVIEVSWSAGSESGDQRITLARSDQAIFTWLQAVKITGDGPVQITVPDEPGQYELRFLDLSNQAVLSRRVITVE